MNDDTLWAVVALAIWLPPMLGIAVHFALKPLIALLAERRADVASPASLQPDPALRREIEHLQQRIAQLEEAETFHRALNKPKDT